MRPDPNDANTWPEDTPESRGEIQRGLPGEHLEIYEQMQRDARLNKRTEEEEKALRIALSAALRQGKPRPAPRSVPFSYGYKEI
jgi:hypothetical protein